MSSLRFFEDENDDIYKEEVEEMLRKIMIIKFYRPLSTIIPSYTAKYIKPIKKKPKTMRLLRELEKYYNQLDKK